MYSFWTFAIVGIVHNREGRTGPTLSDDLEIFTPSTLQTLVHTIELLVCPTPMEAHADKPRLK